jgi:hypothetical protein
MIYLDPVQKAGNFVSLSYMTYLEGELSPSSYSINRKQTKEFIREVAQKNEDKVLKIGKLLHKCHLLRYDNSLRHMHAWVVLSLTSLVF